MRVREHLRRLWADNPVLHGMLLRPPGEPARISDFYCWVVTRASGDEEVLLYDGERRVGLSAIRERVAEQRGTMERLAALSQDYPNPILSYRMEFYRLERLSC